MASFGHAAYFGAGAYAAAIAAQGRPAVRHSALLCGVGFAGLLAVVFGWFCVRLAGVSLAMLTLAFAQITWAIAFQWDARHRRQQRPRRRLATGTARLQDRLLPVHADRRRRRHSSCCGGSRTRRSATCCARCATSGSAPRRSASMPGGCSGLRSRCPARSRGWPVRCLSSRRARCRPIRSRSRARSMRWSWCCSAACRRLTGPVIGAAVFTLLSRLDHPLAPLLAGGAWSHRDRADRLFSRRALPGRSARRFAGREARP